MADFEVGLGLLPRRSGSWGNNAEAGENVIMVKVEDFRAGLEGLPFSCVDEIPDCCFRCRYLVYQEAACALPYYFCGYNLSDRITDDQPACLVTIGDDL
jgi:hypothetical protein